MNTDFSAPPSRNELNGLAQRLCYGLAYLFQHTPLRRFGFRTRSATRWDTMEHCLADRASQVKDYHRLFTPFCPFAAKTILELGCSRGYLLAEFLKSEPFNAVGADIDPEALGIGSATHRNIAFVTSTPTSIPLPDNSVDAIYTVDTVEHLSRPHEIFLDSYRILRPGGVFLIHFHPWLGPYGAHLSDTIPFPWPHLPFSMETLLAAAAHIYDSPDYEPVCYWLDPKTGERRPNPFLDRARWREYLNRITIRKFQRMIKAMPFEQIHFQKIGFSGKVFPGARYLKALAKIPVLDEFFINAVFCVLRKPADPQKQCSCSSEELQ